MKTGRGGQTKTQGRPPDSKRKTRPKQVSDPTDEPNGAGVSTPDPIASAQGEIMAEEKQKNPTAKKGRESEQPSEKNQHALATEKPVPSTPVEKTTQYVVTVDNQTGAASKIEKLDDKTGERQELTRDEYAQVMLYASFSSSPFYAGIGAYTPSSSSAEDDPLLKAYYRGVSDYLNSLSPTK